MFYINNSVVCYQVGKGPGGIISDKRRIDLSGFVSRRIVSRGTSKYFHFGNWYGIMSEICLSSRRQNKQGKCNIKQKMSQNSYSFSADGIVKD